MIIVVGGSLGGCEALRKILQRLPADFPIPIAAALHRHRDSGEILTPVLQEGSALRVVEPEDKQPIEPGAVYVAPPDYHLLLDDNCFSLSADELVNYARPSIDALFESAAEWQGDQVLAVVLTGAGSDGAAGCRRVAAAGGTVVVQDPATAEGLWMPSAAIEASRTRNILSLEQIADFLLRWAQRERSGDLRRA